MSEAIYIIGGGASLKNFDFSKLRNLKTMAVNYAFKFLQPHILTFNDLDVFFECQSDIRSLKSDIYCREEIAESVPGAKPFKLTTTYHGKDGITLGIFGGKRNGEFLSGICALSLAVALGYGPIYLLGYDGGRTGGDLHFHGYSRDKDVFSNTVDNYDVFANEPVVNLNPSSRIDTFPKRAFEVSA